MVAVGVDGAVEGAVGVEVGVNMTSKLKPNELLIAASREGMTVWRNNTGMGWVGKATRLKDGSVLIKDARPLHAGLCVGSSDYIGLRPLVIGPEHVGKTVAQFVAIEEKRGRDRLSAAQRNFLRVINEAGGVGIEARSVEDLLGIPNKPE